MAHSSEPERRMLYQLPEGSVLAELGGENLVTFTQVGWLVNGIFISLEEWADESSFRPHPFTIVPVFVEGPNE